MKLKCVSKFLDSFELLLMFDLLIKNNLTCVYHELMALDGRCENKIIPTPHRLPENALMEFVTHIPSELCIFPPNTVTDDVLIT